MHRYWVGDWLINPVTRQCIGPDREERIPHKVMRVLDVLATQPGAVISRESLLGQVWPDTHATDELLSRAVADLRKLFGDSPKTPAYIETISKTGYRLVARVQPETKKVQPETKVVKRLRFGAWHYFIAGAAIGALTILLFLM